MIRAPRAGNRHRAWAICAVTTGRTGPYKRHSVNEKGFHASYRLLELEHLPDCFFVNWYPREHDVLSVNGQP